MKVSFKKDKEVKRYNDRVTVVTLQGELKLKREFMNNLPSPVFLWLNKLSNPEVTLSYSTSSLIIISEGKTIRAKEDTDDIVIAERIAESRAKIKLYRFMMKFICNIISYYNTLLYGGNEVTNDNDKEVNSKESHFSTSLDAMWDKYTLLKIKEEKHLKELLEKA